MERPQYIAGNGTTTGGSYENRVGSDYDLLPYLSMPFAYTQPSHLEALAALFGVASTGSQSRPRSRARVRIRRQPDPTCARFPKASFLALTFPDNKSTLVGIALPHST